MCSSSCHEEGTRGILSVLCAITPGKPQTLEHPQFHIPTAPGSLQPSSQQPCKLCSGQGGSSELVTAVVFSQSAVCCLSPAWGLQLLITHTAASPSLTLKSCVAQTPPWDLLPALEWGWGSLARHPQDCQQPTVGCETQQIGANFLLQRS